jgi:hypothetical protein
MDPRKASTCYTSTDIVTIPFRFRNISFLIVNWDRALLSKNIIFNDVEQNKLLLISEATAYWANKTVSLSLSTTVIDTPQRGAQDEQK